MRAFPVGKGATLMLSNIGGNMQVSVGSGERIEADAQLSLSTVNGDLLIQILTTRALDVNTINGDVRIRGWSGDRAQIRSLDGDLDMQTSLVKGGRCEIESQSGSINLSLPEQPGFELEANTFNGRIRIDFPIKSEGPIRACVVSLVISSPGYTCRSPTSSRTARGSGAYRGG
ncbi:MAG: DUF4097 family beta strand repeat-containing protein [Vicinamibacterales bacterium]